MNHLIRKTVLFVILVFILALTSIAQLPLPPGSGEEDDQPATPIGSGVVILLVLTVIYGVKKVYKTDGSQVP